MVTAVTSAPTTTNTTPTQADNASTSLAKNFDTFLTLLTTQLKNQDPTSPMDSKEFTTQLVQFTQVEQAINQNKNLEKLIALVGSQQSSNLVSYIGKVIDIESNKSTLSSTQSAGWIYDLPSTATAGELRVIDKNGKVVHTAQLDKTKGEHAFTWDGTLAGGGKAPFGDYRLEVVAKDAAGNSMEATIKTRGVVSSIERVDGEDFLVVNGEKYAVTDVLKLRAASEAPVFPQDNGSYVSYIGKDVEFFTQSSVMQGSSARWTYGMAANASTTKIQVLDAENKVVFETTGDTTKGRHDFSWNGVKTDGTTAKEGEVYTLKVEAKNSDNQAVTVDILGRGKIESLAYENFQAIFLIGSLGLPSTAIAAVRG